MGGVIVHPDDVERIARRVAREEIKAAFAPAMPRPALTCYWRVKVAPDTYAEVSMDREPTLRTVEHLIKNLMVFVEAEREGKPDVPAPTVARALEEG